MCETEVVLHKREIKDQTYSPATIGRPHYQKIIKKSHSLTNLSWVYHHAQLEIIR